MSELYGNEKQSLELENEMLNEKIGKLTQQLNDQSDIFRKSWDNLNNSFSKVATNNFEQSSYSERIRVKLALMEETLQRRNDK